MACFLGLNDIKKHGHLLEMNYCHKNKRKNSSKNSKQKIKVNKHSILNIQYE